MRTALERLMQTMVTHDYARAIGGDVEAPTGHYAIVEIDGSEALTDLSLDPTDGEADILADPAAIGVYMVREDELGFVYVTKAPDLRLASKWFTDCEAAYSEWLDS